LRTPQNQNLSFNVLRTKPENGHKNNHSFNEYHHDYLTDLTLHTQFPAIDTLKTIKIYLTSGFSAIPLFTNEV